MDLLRFRWRRRVRRVLALSVVALVAWSCDARAQAAPVLQAGATINRAASVDLSTYSRIGTGASAEYTRTVPLQYRTASNKLLQLVVTDNLKPTPRNLAKHIAKRAILPGGLALLAGTAALAYLNSKGVTADANGQPIITAARWRWTIGGTLTLQPDGSMANNNAGAIYLASWYDAALLRVNKMKADHEATAGRGPFEILSVTLTSSSGSGLTRSFICRGDYRFKTFPTSDWTAGSFSMNNQPSTGVSSALPASESDIEKALVPVDGSAAAPTDTLFDGAKAPGGPAFTPSADDEGELSPAPAATPAYDQSTTTNPDGSTRTTSSVDQVTATSTGRGTAPANSATLSEKTVTTTVGPEGTTTTETVADPVPDPATDPAADPNSPFDPADIPTGTFNAPGLSADTYLGALQSFQARVAAAPIVAPLSTLGDLLSVGGASCPTTSFSALGASFTFDSHCPVLETFRSVIQTAFAFAWSLLGLFIFFRRS